VSALAGKKGQQNKIDQQSDSLQVIHSMFDVLCLLHYMRQLHARNDNRCNRPRSLRGTSNSTASSVLIDNGTAFCTRIPPAYEKSRLDCTEFARSQNCLRNITFPALPRGNSDVDGASNIQCCHVVAPASVVWSTDACTESAHIRACVASSGRKLMSSASLSRDVAAGGEEI